MAAVKSLTALIFCADYILLLVLETFIARFGPSSAFLMNISLLLKDLIFFYFYSNVNCIATQIGHLHPITLTCTNTLHSLTTKL